MKKFNLTKKIAGVNIDFEITVFDEAVEAISKYNWDSMAFPLNNDTFISLEADEYCFSLVTYGDVLIHKRDGDNVLESYSNDDFEIIKSLVASKEVYSDPYEIVDSNSFQIEYGKIEKKDGETTIFNRIGEPIDFEMDSCNLEDLISMFTTKCELILDDLLYENEITGEILEDGEIERGQTNQGLVYKNPLAFRHKNGICYVSELSDDEYTYEDFLRISNGNEDIASILFETVDWQSPSTLYDEYIQSDEIYECTNCKKSYLSYDIEHCPYCNCKKEID